jgi:zinc transport system ATP-binding protein
MDPLITAQNISFSANGQKILNDISLEIAPQDFITIIGPNGAGKSMLLKCLMRFYEPDEGLLDHKKNLRIGYVPQNFSTNSIMPINVEYFLGLKNKSSKNQVKEIAAELNIANLLKTPVNNLSGGQRQRMLLARALLGNPEILILDEPAQNLDISGQLAFYKMIEEIYQRRQISILMVSHDLHMVMVSTKKVICLFHHICCSGSPNIVAKDPEFISLFGQDMAKMMATYQHSHNHMHECGANHKNKEIANV